MADDFERLELLTIEEVAALTKQPRLEVKLAVSRGDLLSVRVLGVPMVPLKEARRWRPPVQVAAQLR